MKGLNKSKSKQLEEQLHEIIANKSPAEESQPVIIKEQEPQDDKAENYFQIKILRVLMKNGVMKK